MLIQGSLINLQSEHLLFLINQKKFMDTFNFFVLICIFNSINVNKENNNGNKFKKVF